MIIGSGSIGTRHFHILRSLLPSSDIKFLRHLSSNNYPDNHEAFYNISEAILFKPQITVIANPAPMHLEYAMIFAEVGSHLLIEKPISQSKPGVLELIQLCEKRKLVLAVGYNLRHTDSLQIFKSYLDTRIMGKILKVRIEVGSYLPTWRIGRNYTETVSANSKLGGGVLLELSHEIDYMEWIFDRIDWISAFELKLSELDVDVEDSIYFIAGTGENPSTSKFVIEVSLDFIRHDKTRTCIAICEDGTLKWDGLSGEIWVMKEGDDCWKKKFVGHPNFEESYRLQWVDFLKAIENESVPKVTGYDGLQVLDVIEAIRNSASILSPTKILRSYY